MKTTDQIEEDVLKLLSTHTEHDGSYCDTGDDMDWSCRSGCTRMAETRVKAYFKVLKEEEE